ncbi:hypothetical protein C7444_12128 [Sphaerotilus hippei]|uniref:Uncharacterized protein n=1 Tax=Sphaerotilus hippei TaxID=744406 RepID=A0A318H6M5_9BURK|nr:hypothetical protein [Sphaerotilus hippei]PXW93264.1 hypothetical protein C7444_12128 [Sphaerotilus hippei]
MNKNTQPPVQSGDLLSFQPCPPPPGTLQPRRHTYLIGIEDDAASQVLESVMPLLDRLLAEKTAEVRERRLEQMVDFMTEQMLVPSTVDLQMARQLATRHARVLNEFGYLSAEQLADANRSQAANRHALADNWRKRRQVFAVRHPDASARTREVFPAFQFEQHKPIKAVQAILEAFGEHKAPWKIALWFTSNNGWLPDQARPVDWLTRDPEAVIAAARQDAGGSAA